MKSFRNNDNFLESTRTLSDGSLSAIIDASMFCLISLTDDAGRRKRMSWIIFQLFCSF